MFLPINKSEINGELDFVMVTCDAYVDHPTYGHAIISRLIESKGFSIGLIPQPLVDGDYFALPKPKIAYLISGGVVDSMVNNYTVAKRRREGDVYSPLSKQGKRPDRQVAVYSKALKRLFPEIPVVIGGVEASLRRFAHYDYWSDSVRQSELIESGADMLIYGAGEKPFWDILALIKKGVPLHKINSVRGTVVKTSQTKRELIEKGYIELPSYTSVVDSKLEYAKAFKLQAANTDCVSGSVLFQEQKNGEIILQNLPQFPLSVSEMDEVYSYPYERNYHPVYESEGGIKSIEEVKFSVVSHRGCYGSCSFCSINYHQGRRIQKRSDESILQEIELLTKQPGFKGYIHDLSGPSANFREPACDKQLEHGVCKNRYCIGASVCKNLKVDHSSFLNLLRKARQIKGVKKVFIRSGLRFDYLLYDDNCNEILKELIEHHVSGQLKVAPEHMADGVLRVMNKPPFKVYKDFASRYKQANEKLGLKQYLVPYLISSHPGCELKHAVMLTEYLKSINYMPEQVQDFYPTPSTRSTCMYYTGIDPDTLQPVFVPKTSEQKAMQRALLQYRLPKNREAVKKAYLIAGLNAEVKKTNQKTHTGPKKFIKGEEVYRKSLSSRQKNKRK